MKPKLALPEPQFSERHRKLGPGLGSTPSRTSFVLLYSAKFLKRLAYLSLRRCLTRRSRLTDGASPLTVLVRPAYLRRVSFLSVKE